MRGPLLASSTPPAPDPRARAVALGRMLIGGGLLGLIAVAAAVGRDLPQGRIAVLAGATLVVGVLVRLVGHRLPAAAFHALLAAGWGVVALATHLAGDARAALAFALLVVWAALYAGLFFTPLATALHTVGAVTLVALALPGGTSAWLFEIVWLAGVAGMVGGVTNWISTRRARSRLDALTGLPSARGLADVLEERMRGARSRGTPLAVGLLDLDHFREVNLLRGPGAGDALLRDCVGRWRAELPAGATLARRASDEFVVVLPGQDLHEARDTVDRLRRALAPGVTCSAGVATWEPDDTQSLLLARADTALYAAKMAGRDRTEAAGEDDAWAAELHRGIADHEIEVHFQPVHAVDDQRLVGLEALVRWRHPDRGLLPPAAFLPAAERSGAIHELGRRVLDLSCRQLRRWHDAHPAWARLRVSVNVSTAQLTGEGLVADVDRALRRHGLEPSALLLEVTEGALVDEFAETAAVLWELKDRGVQLALDDFGTGHSSLSRLRSLPFDVVKIDRSFVQPLAGDDPAAEALFAVIVRMAGTLGMAAVVEGIETRDELVAATRHGARYVQGFLLGRPMPSTQLEAHLDAGAPTALATDEDVRLIVLDELPEPGPRGELRALLAHVLDVTGFDAAFVSRVDLRAREQQVLVAQHGAATDVRVAEGARIDWRDSVCRHALLEGGATATTALRSPAVGDAVVRSYAVAPVELPDGTLIGTVCAVSTRQQAPEPATEQLMALVARLVAAHAEGGRLPDAPAAPMRGGGVDTGPVRP